MLFCNAINVQDIQKYPPFPNLMLFCNAINVQDIQKYI